MKTPDLFPQSLQHQALSEAAKHSDGVNDITLRHILEDIGFDLDEVTKNDLRQKVDGYVLEPGPIKVESRSYHFPLSHRDDPATSHDAAQSVKEVSKQHRVMCLTALALYGPMTAHEVAARCKFDHWSVAARRLTELHEQGTIERIHTDVPGVYQTRKTPSGRQACLWRVVRA